MRGRQTYQDQITPTGHTSTQNILSFCDGCYQTCINQHDYKKQHKKINKNIFVENIKLNVSEQSKLHKNILELSMKIQNIINFLLDMKDDIESNYHDSQKILRFDLENQMESDRYYILQAIKKIEDNNFAKIKCDEIDRLNNQIKYKSLMSLEDRAKNIQKKYCDELYDHMNKLFKNLPKSTVNQQQRSRKQTITSKQSQIDKNQRDFMKQKISDQIIPLVTINQIRKIISRFDIIVKIIHIAQQNIKIRGQTCSSILVGDHTGIGICVIRDSTLIKKDNYIKIIKGRIYNFHGSKQIQLSNDSIVTQMRNQNFNVDYQYALSNHAKTIYDEVLIQKGEPKRQERRQERIFRKQDGEDRQRKLQKRYRRPNNKQNGERRQNRGNQQRDQRRPQRPERRNYQQQQQARQRRINTNRNQKRDNRNDHRDPRTQNRRDNNRTDNRRDQRVDNRRPNQNNRRGNQRANDRRQQHNNNRQPRRRQDQRQMNRQDSNKLNWTRIQEIDPNDQNLNIMASVLSVEYIRSRNPQIKVQIGDPSGVVYCELPLHYEQYLKIQAVYQFININPIIQNQHILMVLDDRKGDIKALPSMRFKIVNKNNDISAKQYQEENDDY